MFMIILVPIPPKRFNLNNKDNQVIYFFFNKTGTRVARVHV